MLDRLRLMIPFSPVHVTGAAAYLTAKNAMAHDHKGMLLDVLHLGIPLGARAVALADHEDRFFKDWQIDEIYHPFESLESSFTPLAFKVFHDCNHYPYVEIKASPAKLLQGHNIFGTTDIELGSTEMLVTLAVAYPKLYFMLEIESTQVWELDVTYSARMKNDYEAQQVMDMLKKVSNGQTKARGDEYQTTCYWGAKNSRLKRLKAYLKSIEYEKQMLEYKKKSEAGDATASRVYNVMSDPRLIEWSKGLIRFESTICKRWLERRDIPFLLTDLIHYQQDLKQQGRCLLAELWKETTSDIFAAFEGQTMKITDDDSVLEQLKAVHFTMTPKGNISYTKAHKLMLFFISLREQGYHAIKKLHNGNQTFYRHIKQLQEAGFSKAFLQNLHGESQSNVVPLLRFVDVDFSSQLPNWYQEPVSQFLKVA
ncbi:phage/plasmid replication protein, II/X family [Acinetobacter populi]|uniref:Replication protein n=1 Tax=Acinetobacter populi TaxID=1582270 RepID=A0A1Z9YTM5_9GAMM|nr:phage/plasmid replication protein, II/X family [Acinetobacter populi]OUY05509.1 hypothetical protein CAP51_17005 [Acinetobacter populi]